MSADVDPSRLDHLVVLMLENRSFDCLLGYLYELDSPARFVGDGDHVFGGVAGLTLTNPDDEEPPRLVPVTKAPWQAPDDMCHPCPDPGELHHPNVNRQLYGTSDPDPLPYPEPMNGFVRDYIAEMIRQSWVHGRPSYEQYARVMQCFPPEATPVTSGLARAFAVSDAWFASVPSQTFCNRSFLHSAQSHGFVDNSDYVKWLENDAPTIFDRLSGAGRDWRIYWDPEDGFSLTGLLHRRARLRYADHWRSIDAFEADCVAGTLPAYSFIEPRLFVNHNDMHPPVWINPIVHSSILAGELLVNRVYDAVRRGKDWERTLLLIVFDEHGGTYDHVPPPRGAKPPLANPPYPLEAGFRFERFGVRVPAIFVSPWVSERTVVRATGSTPFDHTSVLSTLARRWSLEPLTDRDRAAPDFTSVVGLRDTPRPNIPTFVPRRYTPLPVAAALAAAPSSLHRDVVGLASAVRGVEAPALSTLGDALQHLRRLV
jgi:phospholipase C